MEHHGIEMIGGFINEVMTTLPVWTATDEGRQVYLTDGSVWVGTNIEWKDISAGGTGGGITEVDYKGDVSGVIDCDTSLYGVFDMNIIGTTTLTFSGFVVDQYKSVVVKMSNGITGVTFTNSVWSGAVQPSLTLGIDRLVFSSSDGGATIYGGLSGRDFS